MSTIIAEWEVFQSTRKHSTPTRENLRKLSYDTEINTLWWWQCHFCLSLSPLHIYMSVTRCLFVLGECVASPFFPLVVCFLFVRVRGEYTTVATSFIILLMLSPHFVSRVSHVVNFILLNENLTFFFFFFSPLRPFFFSRQRYKFFDDHILNSNFV